jgi:hypothetical protein
MAAIRHVPAASRDNQASRNSLISESGGLVVPNRTDAGAGSRSHLLPLFSVSFIVAGQRVCGGGRNLVPCSLGAPAAAAPAAGAAGAVAAAPPRVTPGAVLTELRRIGLPALLARTQPKVKTLVNFDTIFYTTPHTVTRNVTLLGQPVLVEARPESFTWNYGDGDSSITTDPGEPYPAKDITHQYLDAHITVRPSVDVSYSGRFRVGNGPWQEIPGTVTIAGPTTPLRVSEATPVLSGDY